MSQALFLLLFVLLISACGGGGGGGSSSEPVGPSSAAARDSASVDEESSVTIDVTANDTSVDPATVGIASQPSNGSVEISGSDIVYTPDTDFEGTDSFQYSVTGTDGSRLTATVTVTVNDINDAPVAVDDAFTIVEDNPLTLTLGENDEDIDGTLASFEIIGDVNGVITGSGASLTYTPPLDFIGEVTFDYRGVDDDGAVSNRATVTITIEPVTATQLEAVALAVPQTGYAAGNDAELARTVLLSPAQPFDVPPNAVSLLLSLNGADANIDEGGLFIASIEAPSGQFPVFQRFVHFCFGGNCTALIPRLPDYQAESGVWTYRLGSLADTTDTIDFSSLSLSATFRSGPTPEVAIGQQATFIVQPHLTADTVTVEQIEAVMARLVEIGADSQVTFDVQPVNVLTEAQFDIVSASFLDATTAAMVSQGAASAVNLFFVEDFSDQEDLGGISGGIPGTLGLANGFNGVLIDADVFESVNESIYIDDTAKTAFHEMGHLLGLYHTTEARFSFNDVISDTPNCEIDVHDTDNDGVADASECPDADNPMFWFDSALIEETPLTDDQKHVLFFSPLATP